MDEAGDGRLPREVPSVALDQLFLEIHDHLPRDARGKLAQLADEVKKLTECSGCCRNHLRYRSSGGYSHSSTNTEDPNCRLVQYF